MDPMTIAMLGQTAGQLIGGISAGNAAIKAKGYAKASGILQQKMHEFEAKQYEQAAKGQQAVGVHNAQEELRKSKLVQSRALAIAGASGAGVSDPNVNKILGDIAAEGELAAGMHLFNGEEAARGLRLNASVSRWQGKQARRGAAVQAAAIGDQMKAQQLQTVLSLAGTAATWAARTPNRTTPEYSNRATELEGAKLAETTGYGEPAYGDW